jgi:hydrogenase large subunit
MSHILHFYHLVALDYVIPTVVTGWTGGTTGTPVPIDRPFLAPRYDNKYYISNARVLALVPVLSLFPQYAPALGVLTNLPGQGGGDIAGGINAYLTGQYLKALDIRRKCHELQAIFSGRAPQCSGFTPGGATATVTDADITAARTLLNQIRAFVGEPLDFRTGTPGTMMFDVVAAAHVFPEYFWIGNAYHNFMAFGCFEETGTFPLTGQMAAVFGATFTNADGRGLTRGWKTSAASGATKNAVDIMKIAESIGYSRYKKTAGRNYLDGVGFKHPWTGVTQPDANADTATPDGYSWLKSPRYDIGSGNYQPFEVGPLSRMVVQGMYWAGVLNALPLGGYPLAPAFGAAGPDCAGATDLLGATLKPVYAAITGVGGPNLSGVAYTGDSVIDRIAARAVETRLMIDLADHFLTKIDSSGGDYKASGCTDPALETLPLNVVKKGYGMTEASRGALSHWIKAKRTSTGTVTTLYQAIVPTTWNANPRDKNGVPGPSEKSLTGAWVANPAEPIELPRITHSYDFCIACAVHLISPEGEVIKVDIPAMPG